MSDIKETQGSFQKVKKIIEDDYSQKDWTESVKATLGILPERPWNWSIYKVPNKLQKVNQDSYNPRIISIGPFHHHKEELLAMEEHKWRYMKSLLDRKSPNQRKTLDACLEVVKEKEKEARGCYAADVYFNKDKLMEILLVDGCFILELFLRYSEKNKENRDYEDDKIVNNAWMVPTLRHDFALLENQIPLSILKSLLNSIGIDSMPISNYALGFFDLKCSNINLDGSRHLLEMLHKYYLPLSFAKSHPKDQDTWGFKHRASKLLEAGIEIKKGRTGHLLNITFNNDLGEIEFPPLCIDDTLESIFRNLIAFEQCSVGTTHHITSYVMLIKGLIDSPEDIELLIRRKGIITNKLSGDQDVSTFFHSICREVVLKEFYFTQLCEIVNAYTESWWHWHRIKASLLVRWRRYMAALKNDYFSNPWRIISFIAAVVLLILTALQTIYTMRS